MLVRKIHPSKHNFLNFMLSINTRTGLRPSPSQRSENTQRTVMSCYDQSAAENHRPSKRQRLEPHSTSGSRIVRRITASFTSKSLIDSTGSNEQELNPKRFLKDVLQSKGINADEYASHTRSNGLFLEPTEELIASYGQDLIHAVRSRNIYKLREVFKEGDRSLQCCNKYGESLIHMACRRGFKEVVEFLIQEAGVSIRIRDDCGRTPMHDAFWTCEPNFELMQLLIETDPGLLLVKDRRGHTPFDYARREHWAHWVHFLDERQDILFPRGSKKFLVPNMILH